MPIPSDKYKKIKLQMYQLWFGHPDKGGDMLAEDSDLTRLLRFAKEQIKEEAWGIDTRDYRHICLIRIEVMEFNFSMFMKGTGLKQEKNK